MQLQCHWINLTKKGWEVKSVSYNKLSSGLLHSSLSPRTVSYRKISRKGISKYSLTRNFIPTCHTKSPEWDCRSNKDRLHPRAGTRLVFL